MKNRYIKLLVFLLTVFFAINSTGRSVHAQYTTLRFGGDAKVLEILDGDAIKVQMVLTKDIALVKLIGISPVNSDTAFTYLNNAILGHVVNLVKDDYIIQGQAQSRWNLMYVYLGDRYINNELLEKGYAQLNPEHSNARGFGTLSNSESFSQSRELGVWTVDEKYKNYYNYYSSGSGGSWYYSGDGININTASSSKLRELLTGADQSIASSIISYRSGNPFKTMGDIKFVSGFSKDLFDRNKGQLAVSTNINRASEKELLTLGSLDQYDVDRIVNYRKTTSFTDISELQSKGIISNSKYEEIRHFIDITDRTVIYYTIPNIVANINAADVSQLMSAGLSESQAQAVVSSRGSYSYKTLGELQYISGVNLSTYDIHRLADNLSLTADTSGTASNYSNYININTATESQLRSIGLSDNQASRIYYARGRMYMAADIPVDITGFDSRISLFTNINKASSEELMSLSTEMTATVASEIITYRNDQPFGSVDEFGSFLQEKNLRSLYNSISRYVVVR